MTKPTYDKLTYYRMLEDDDLIEAATRGGPDTDWEAMAKALAERVKSWKREYDYAGN